MITIIPFSADTKLAFYEINVEWISSMFTLEELDEQILRYPEKHVLEPGGYIWFARHAELGLIGTCALRKTADREYELTKMAVLESARGLKAGEKLLQFVIQYVKTHQLGECYLLTNRKCEAAIHLYQKNGFVHDETLLKKFGQSYDRCDVAMCLS